MNGFAVLLGLGLVVAAAAPRVSTIFAGGAWAAIDRGASCEALSRSVRIAAKGKVQATAGFAFSPDHRRWGEFHAHLSRVPRSGSSVMLQIGDQPFLLVARGDWAWSRGPLQEQAIIAAARDLIGDARSKPATAPAAASSIPTSSTGAPTAIDAAAARCALRGAGKIQ